MIYITTDIKDLVSLLSASLPLVLAYSLKVTSWSERFYGTSSIKSITTDVKRKREWQTEFPSAVFILCILGIYRPETLHFCLYFTAQKLVCYSSQLQGKLGSIVLGVGLLPPQIFYSSLRKKKKMCNCETTRQQTDTAFRNSHTCNMYKGCLLEPLAVYEDQHSKSSLPVHTRNQEFMEGREA